MRLTVILSLIVLNLPQWSWEQDSTLNLIRTIEIDADRFTTDRLGHIYYTKGDQIVKLNAEGNVLYENSNKFWGEPDIFDASQPLRIMLYYSDQMLLTIFDNTLSLQNEPISFEELGLIQATLVANSNNNNNLWVFDQGNFELNRLSSTFDLQYSSGNLSNTLGLELVPTFMTEFDNRLYMANPETGILVFDLLGTYIKQIPIRQVEKFQVWDQGVFYMKDGQLHKYNLKTFETRSIDLPDSVRSFRLSVDELYLLTDKGIGVYQLPF